MADINVWAALAGAVASFILGALWYSPVLFLKPWMRESGLSPDQPPKQPARVFILAFVFSVVSAFALALLAGPAPALGDAVLKGLIAGAFLVAASMGINYQFANRNVLVWLIDGGFHTARLAVVGIVLGLWH